MILKRPEIKIKIKLKKFLPLIKSLQTALLLFTGITGYISAKCPVLNFSIFFPLMGTLFLTISGSTILNMYFDRDIDGKMERTAHRPLPSGQIKPKEALISGLFFSLAGIFWALSLSPLYGIIISAGLFFDVIVYTLLLKRKTPWSIIWGGVSGGMPILAGRALALGRIDWIGILFALSILLWIPTHILTFSMIYYKDYHKAGIPTFPSVYGFKYTRLIIAISSIGASFSILLGFLSLGMSWGYMRLLAILTVGFIGLAFMTIIKKSEKINFGLFKYASLYMLGAMLMLILGG
jgi:protoheme IX farnesyltransferase